MSQSWKVWVFIQIDVWGKKKGSLLERDAGAEQRRAVGAALGFHSQPTPDQLKDFLWFRSGLRLLLLLLDVDVDFGTLTHGVFGSGR